MRGRSGQFLPVVILVIIALLVALTTQVVLANNARLPDADITFRANLIIMRIKVREFIANSWVNENTDSQHSVSNKISVYGPEEVEFNPWYGFVRSEN